MTRGVKQGCPLSAILFVFIFDLLLKALIRDLNLIDGVVVGVADDVAVALEDLWLQLPIVLNILTVWAEATSMEVNCKKCVIIPLFTYVLEALRSRIAIDIPGASNFLVSMLAKYLGVWVGPEADEVAWNEVLENTYVQPCL